MLGLKLREEFRGTRLKGVTTVDVDPQAKSGALKVSATDFLRITYPSHDLLRMIEAIQPKKSDPVVVLGDRGQGKSHLLATIYHLCRDPEVGKAWLSDWSIQLKDDHLRSFSIRTDCHIIADSLHHQRYKHLWDLVFKIHPEGARIRGKWEASGTPVPGYDLMMELFTAAPTILILDEFQTWFDGLTDTKQYPWKKWAFNY